MNKLRILILIITTAILTTQCKPKLSNKKIKENSLENKKWFLKEFNGKKINKKLDGYYILFDSNNNRLVTKVGCNNITSNYEIDKNTLKINTIVSTRMACHNEQINETEYTQKIKTVKKFSVNNNTLTLKGDDNQIIAIYFISE